MRTNPIWRTFGVVVLVFAAAVACQPTNPVVWNPSDHSDGHITPPLSTRGPDIVDADGDTVVLAGVNWFGFETDTHVPHGLWARDYKDMLHQMASLGYNTIRLPFSVQALRAPSISSVNYSLGGNSELQGLTPLQAMDKIIAAAADEGLLVLLDNHRLNESSIPDLWYGDGFTEQDWIDTWTMLATRYRDQWNVIGGDLKNEPHGAATWGTGNIATDWNLAAQRGGNAVLSIAPNWLIVVEGIGGDVAGQQLDGHWWGGNLEGVRNKPVTLNVPNRVVYSPHEYGPGVFDQPWFSSPDLEATLFDRWQKGFAFIPETGIAPVLVGEYGGRAVDMESVEGRWQNQFVDFLRSRRYSWTYWAWNPNSSDTGGILLGDWHSIDEAKQAMLDRALEVGGVNGVGAVAPGSTTTSSTSSTSTTSSSTSTTTTSVPPAGSLVVSSRVTSRWATGSCVQFAVTNNTATTTSTTTIRFALSGGTLTTTWNGSMTKSGTNYTVTVPDWARSLAPGQTIESFGYCADPDLGASPSAMSAS